MMANTALQGYAAYQQGKAEDEKYNSRSYYGMSRDGRTAEGQTNTNIKPITPYSVNAPDKMAQPAETPQAQAQPARGLAQPQIAETGQAPQAPQAPVSPSAAQNPMSENYDYGLNYGLAKAQPPKDMNGLVQQYWGRV